MNKYIKNYILSTANIIMMLLFPIITFPYVSRILGPSNLGIINFAQSYGYYFTHIAGFGISSYAIREVSKIRDDKEKTEKISNEIFNLNLFFSILSTILYFCGVFFVQNFRNNFVIFVIYSVVIFSNFLSLDWLLQSFDDYYFSTIRNLIIRVFSVAAVFIFIKHEEDYIKYMAITCVTEMGTKVSTLMYCRKNYAMLRVRKMFLNFKDHIKPMFVLFTFRLVNGISSNLDKLMIGFMIEYVNVGIYSAGVKFVLMISPIVETVGIVLFPKINISAGNSSDEYIKNLKINYDMILLMGIPMAVGMYLVSGRLIPFIAGGQYAEAVTVSRIMSGIILLGPIGDMLGSKTLLVFKKDRCLLVCSSAVALSNVVLNFAFIPLWGINGAAIASILSYIVAVSARYYFTRKLVKINLFNKSLVKYGFFTVPFIILYVLFQSQIDTNTLWMFGFIGVCGLIYVSELLLSGDYLVRMMLEKTIKKGKV